MIKIEMKHQYNWNLESVIMGMRNPMNSWDRSDSHHFPTTSIGNNDMELMKKLVASGDEHAKFMRMINIYLDITAPLYWWKEFDTYKIGTVTNSCSTMHKIHEKEFTLDDFSVEHLSSDAAYAMDGNDFLGISPMHIFKYYIIDMLNTAREKFLETNNKRYWYEMIQLLPSSYNQRRMVMINYQTLRNIYKQRRGHKLDEWCDFCKFLEYNLPYNELITKED